MLVLATSACGGGPGGGSPVDGNSSDGPTTDGAIDAAVGVDAPAGGCPTSGRYLGLRTGEHWTYRVTDAATGAVAYGD